MSVAIATVGKVKQFKSGAQIGAWLGLTPKRHTSGGKSKLSTITRRSIAYLRAVPNQGPCGWSTKDTGAVIQCHAGAGAIGHAVCP